MNADRCSNTLIIKGKTKEHTDAFWLSKEFIEANGLFNAFVTRPDSITELNEVEKWNKENWGVEAEAEDVDYGEDAIHFDSAWVPPEAFLDFLSRVYPDVMFELYYSNAGRMMAGNIRKCKYMGVDKSTSIPISFDADGEPVGFYKNFLNTHNLHTGG